MSLSKKFITSASILLLVFFLVGPNFTRWQKQKTGSDKRGNSDSYKAEIGRRLFFDPILSPGRKKSCSSCHNPEFAFTDGYRRSFGLETERVKRNSPTLINVSEYRFFNLANSDLHTIESQILHPLFINTPFEMGTALDKNGILQQLLKDELYGSFLQKAYPDIPLETIGWEEIIECLAEYVKKLRSYDSPYDCFISTGDSSYMSPEALRGMQIFYSKKTQCSQCHNGINFSIAATEKASEQNSFANTGLYNIAGEKGYPSLDKGIYNLSKNAGDDGRFRIPTLRNLAFTAPYYHDGSAATLSEVIDNYARGGRNYPYGAIAGDGSCHPAKHPLISGFKLNETEKQALAAFLLSLSDSTVIHNSFFRPPQESIHSNRY